MNRAAKITIGFSAAVVAGLVAFAVAPALGAPAEQPTTTPASAPTKTPTPEAGATDVPAGYVNIGNGISIPEGGPGDCTASSWIHIGSEDDGPMQAEMLGADLVDMGPREYANGTVGLDDQGNIATYTVAAGDAEYAIGDRFCIANALTIGLLNGYSHGNAIQPGDVLTLNANLVTDWVDPYGDG